MSYIGDKTEEIAKDMEITTPSYVRYLKSQIDLIYSHGKEVGSAEAFAKAMSIIKGDK